MPKKFLCTYLPFLHCWDENWAEREMEKKTKNTFPLIHAQKFKLFLRKYEALVKNDSIFVPNIQLTYTNGLTVSLDYKEI